jgi:ectoine hydroxylase-related dioxygenase (phytanoyl-CoA dioxygenase family)
MWHRDRLGSVPDNQYVRPVSIVFISYLQHMSDEAGPLRVIPGSHRRHSLLDDTALFAQHSDEVLICAQPGDVIALHHNLLHSGSCNTSGQERRFFGFIYNLSTLRQEDNFAGPNCTAIIESARRANDRRLQRLLGNDPLIVPRQNSGFTRDHNIDWQQWRDEDLAFAAEARSASDLTETARASLALPDTRIVSPVPSAPHS